MERAVFRREPALPPFARHDDGRPNWERETSPWALRLRTAGALTRAVACSSSGRGCQFHPWRNSAPETVGTPERRCLGSAGSGIGLVDVSGLLPAGTGCSRHLPITPAPPSGPDRAGWRGRFANPVSRPEDRPRVPPDGGPGKKWPQQNARPSPNRCFAKNIWSCAAGSRPRLRQRDRAVRSGS
jgi:hypothetical protein